jgi:hypothetical protein
MGRLRRSTRLRRVGFRREVKAKRRQEEEKIATDHDGGSVIPSE